MMPLTPVVRNLLIINVIMFVASMAMPQLQRLLMLYPVMSEYFKPFQLVTSFFMHADLLHIAFNMMTLASIGSMLEMVWREERFLFYYLFCAVGASLIHLAIQYYQYQNLLGEGLTDIVAINQFGPALGASGAIFGLVAAVGFLYPETEFGMFLLPIRFKGKYWIPILLVYEYTLGRANFANDNIGHFAHLGGAISGILLLVYWNRNSILKK